MRFLTRFSLRNPVAVIILVLLVAVAGIVSALGLQEDLMPNLSIPILSISTSYPGASPKQVATDVTAPLEKALNGTKDVQTVTSTSLANVSEIELQLNVNATLNSVEQTVQQTVDQVKLPSAAGTPSVRSFSFSQTPVLAITVASGTLSQEKLKSVVNQKVIPALQGAAGVSTVTAAGAAADNVVITFKPKKLAHYGLSLQQVLADLQGENTTMPLGSATAGGKVQPVQLHPALTSLADIRRLPIALPSNAAVKQQQALGNSLSKMGQSIGQLGQSLGKVASGVGQVGQGVGIVQAENQVLAKMQQLQGETFGAQMALAQEQALPPSQQNQRTLAQLQSEIPALQKAQTQLEQQLVQLEQRLKQTLGSASGSPATAASSSVSQSSTPSAAGSGTSGAAVQSTTLRTIPLSDLATVSLKPPAARSVNRTNGQPSILVTASKSENANTVTVAKALRQQLATVEAQLPAGVKVVPLFDASKMITSSVNDVLREAVLGALFAVVVILLFLRNWRTTLVAVVSIPISILGAMILLGRFGVTLNIMTLGGLAVATGRVVDDSIVVIENIFRTWRSGFGFGRRLIAYAVSEVGTAILSSTLATIAVFLPLTLVGGIVGRIFFPFALTVVVSLICSLLVALTVVPILAWLFVVRRPLKGAVYDWLSERDAASRHGTLIPELAATGSQLTDEWGERVGNVTEGTGTTGGALEAPVGNALGSDLLSDTAGHLRPWQLKYRAALDWALNHKLWVTLTTAAALVASILILPLVGSTFIQNSVQQTATVSITMPVGTPLSVTEKKAMQVEAVLHKDTGDVKRINTSVGGGQFTGGTPKSNTASLLVALKANTNVNAFLQKARNQTHGFATGKTKIQVQGQATGGGSTTFDIVVNGDNSAAIRTATTAVADRLQHFSGLANVQSNLAQTQPEVRILPKLKEAAKYGLTAQQVAGQVSSYLSQQRLGTVTVNGQSYDMEAALKKPSSLSTLKDIRKLPVTALTGQSLTLGEVATVSEVQTPTSVLHENGQTYAEITADYTTSNTNKTLSDALKAIDAMNLPKGVTVGQSAGALQQSNSFRQLIEAILVAVGIVYIVMLILFGEWSAPLSILFSMPVALIGAFFGSLVAGEPLSVSSLIGILMLMGIVVTNAIVLIQRVEQQRSRGMTVREALLEAGTTRLRPILMTAVATICALLPLALGASQSVLISKGLAVVVIGGLVTSTLLTLCIVPLVYELLHWRIHRRERRALE